jgi:hypothetical protein
MQEAEVEGLQFKVIPAKNVSPYLKSSYIQREWGMAQVVEHLASNHKALSKKTKKQKIDH